MNVFLISIITLEKLKITGVCNFQLNKIDYLNQFFTLSNIESKFRSCGLLCAPKDS